MYFQMTLRGIPVVEAVGSGQWLLYAVHRVGTVPTHCVTVHIVY